MVSQSCLTDPTSLVVLDSSAAINLTASRFGAEVAAALPNRLATVDVVLSELAQGRKRGRPHADLLDALVAGGHVEIVTLDATASRHFEKLVIGKAAATLDDGEAATIAYAAQHAAVPIIDERKATRICAERFPHVSVGCTGDLFAHPSIEAALGRERLAQAVLNALQSARMRVLPHYTQWVVDLIGPKNVAACRSLPRGARAAIEQI